MTQDASLVRPGGPIDRHVFYRRRRFRLRVGIAFVLMVGAVAATAYVWALSARPEEILSIGDRPLRSVVVHRWARLGLAGLLADALALGCLLLAMKPARRSPGRFGTLAVIEVAVSAFLLPVLLWMYWRLWSPLCFLT